MADVVHDEAGDEKIAVIVAGLHAQGQGVFGRGTGFFEQCRFQLLLEEVVGLALVDQDREAFGGFGDQLASVIVAPLVPVRPEIVAQGLFAPGALHGRANRGEGGDRLVLAGVFKRDGERAVAAHGVAHDGTAFHVYREIARRQYARQFIDHIIVHAVIRRPWGLGGVDIEARAESEVPGAVRIVGNAFAPGAGVGADDGDARLGRITLGAGLLHEVIVGAGQSRQPPDRRHEALRRLGRQVDRERHLATENLGAVLQLELPAAEAGDGTDRFRTHDASCR